MTERWGSRKKTKELSDEKKNAAKTMAVLPSPPATIPPELLPIPEGFSSCIRREFGTQKEGVQLREDFIMNSTRPT